MTFLRGGRFTAWASLASCTGIAASTGLVAAQTLRPQRPLTLVVGSPPAGARMDRIGPSRAGSSRSALPVTALRVAWRTSVGALLEHAPVVDALANTYLVGTRGEVVALADDGAEKWRAATGTVLPGPAVILSDDTIAFVDASGDALAIRDGHVRWKAHLGKSDTARPAPLPLDDGGLVAAAGRDLVALDAEGQERARARLPESVVAPLLAFRGKILAVTATGALWSWAPGALDATRLGSFGSPIDGSAALTDEHTAVAVTTAGARLTAIDLRDGASSTRAVPPAGLFSAAPAAEGGVVYLLALTPTTEVVFAIDPAGRELGSTTLRARAASLAPDGGAPSLPPGAHTPPIVDSTATVVFATGGGAVGSAGHLTGTPEPVEMLAAACSASASGAASPAPVAGLAPLGPGSVVVACRHGDVLSVVGRAAQESGDSAGQRL